MTIKELIQEYKEERALGTMYNVESRVMNTFRNISDAMYRNLIVNKKEALWQKELNEVSDNSAAMFAFFEMSQRKIDQKLSAVLSYYFATKILKGNYPNDLKRTAHSVRAVVIFQNNSHFYDYCMATDNYKGVLDKEAFFNLLLLSEYYNAEGNPLGSEVLNKMTPIANKVASFYSEFSKSQVIALGGDASNYLYDYICSCLGNKAFPISCL